MRKVKSNIVIIVLSVLLVISTIAIIIVTLYAQQQARQVVFMGLEMDRFSTLNASSVNVPVRTQTPGIFEPTLTAIADLNLRKPVLKQFDSTTMVEVPAGCFFMGSTEFPDTEPISQQCFNEPFWIGQTEVTNAQYQLFVDDGGYSNQSYWTDAGWSWRNTNTNLPYEDHRKPYVTNVDLYNNPDQPIVNLTWFEASAYAAWLNKRYKAKGIIIGNDAVRLPTEAEWEYAARGPDSRRYTWGAVWDQAKAVTFSGDMNNYPREASAVGNIPTSASWVGVLDMDGNVSEWVNTIYKPYPYYVDDGRENTQTADDRLIRSAAYDNDKGSVSLAFRQEAQPSTIAIELGFRVAMSIHVGES